MTTSASQLATRTGKARWRSGSGVKVKQSGEGNRGQFSGIDASDPLSLGFTESSSVTSKTNKSTALAGGRFAALERVAAENGTRTANGSVAAQQPQIGFFSQELFGIEMRVIMPFVAVLGVAIGMCLGLALYGTKAHTLLVGSIPFLS